MTLQWEIVPLAKHHDRKNFRCGEAALDDYLARFARQNHESGIARTFVAVDPQQPNRIVGYYSLTVGQLAKANFPDQVVKRLPHFPIPVARLARLAVDQSLQGQGLGEDLLVDALLRCLRIAEETGIFAVVLDAKHDKAKAFYARYEFEALPDQPLVLWLPLAALAHLQQVNKSQ
ncbi:GNAT family N-acetyltransferase [Thiothrix unzii]|uniref:GNAT family N-acetyltransferase n=1 Tax=Thiothrix unzii TaxID=111769 RepID=A0A975F8C5_9GAMM|nr:GNAT family N-acetyltransferase [Thiothrix unzii]QTR52839.1 GNAT family N-acetyltransferase [Thiothrix unzii]